MENHILEKEKMDSIKALSDVNIRISEAKNLLFKLQEDETTYLIAREKKALDRIQKVVDDSKELVKKADENYAQIKELLSGVSDFNNKLLSVQSVFTQTLSEFDERNVEWEKKIGKQQDDIQDVLKKLKVERVEIENGKKALDFARKILADDQKKLDSDRGTIQRTIERLKNNRI